MESWLLERALRTNPACEMKTHKENQALRSAMQRASVRWRGFELSLEGESQSNERFAVEKDSTGKNTCARRIAKLVGLDSDSLRQLQQQIAKRRILVGFVAKVPVVSKSQFLTTCDQQR